MRDRQAAWVGSRLHKEGLVTANFGNISYRGDNGFYIKREGDYMDDLGDMVFVPMEGDASVNASREWVIHREVYRKTSHQAIIHAHPVYAVATSFIFDEVIPLDCEGELFCPRIPVVTGRSGSEELACHVARALTIAPAVIVHGHGTFTAGSTLKEAYIATSAVEHACRILLLVRGMAGRNDHCQRGGLS